MIKSIKKFFKKESGATAIEYGLIAALIAVAVISGARLVGGELDATFNAVETEMRDARTNTPAAPTS